MGSPRGSRDRGPRQAIVREFNKEPAEARSVAFLANRLGIDRERVRQSLYNMLRDGLVTRGFEDFEVKFRLQSTSGDQQLPRIPTKPRSWCEI